MAIYRFRVAFEENEDITRDIDIKGGQTFLDLHNAIHTAIGFNPDFKAQFFMSNDYWHKGDEIGNVPSANAKPLDKVKIAEVIEDPHQKIYYVFTDTKRIWIFYITLTKLVDETVGKIYPLCFKTNGIAPKQFIVIPKISKEDDVPFEDDDIEEIDDSAAYDEEDYNQDGIEEEESETKDEFAIEGEDEFDFGADEQIIDDDI